MSGQDVFELQQLAYRYAAAVDLRDPDGFADLFTADGRLRTYRPSSPEPFRDRLGREQLAIVPRAMDEQTFATAHQMTNHLIEVSGETATGSLLCTARHMFRDQPGVAINIVLRYTDAYVKQDGRWKIADRKIQFLWSERTEIADDGLG